MTEPVSKYEFGVAITGGIGCGKSAIGKILREQGQVVIDADQLARLAVAKNSPGLHKLVSYFGRDILQENGELDRQHVATMIFNAADKRTKFEEIVHPQVKRELEQALKRAELGEHRWWFYEIPLLFEKNLQTSFGKVWVAHCPQDIQIQRITHRDGRSHDEIEKIIQSQVPQLKKKEMADVVINTHCSWQELKNQVQAALANLLSKHTKR